MKRLLDIFIPSVLCIVIAGSVVDGVAQSNQQPRIRWEYKIMRLTSDFEADFRELNSLGSEGWEMIETGIGRAIFKRNAR